MKRITGPQTPIHIYEARLPGDSRIVVCVAKEPHVLSTHRALSSSSTKLIVCRSFRRMCVKCTLRLPFTHFDKNDRANIKVCGEFPNCHSYSSSRHIFRLLPVLTIHGIMGHTEIRRSVWERIGRLLGRRGKSYQERCVIPSPYRPASELYLMNL